MSKKKNIDHAFHQKLRDFEEQPPEVIWSGISEGLTRRKKKRTMIFFLRAAAGIALLIMLGVGYDYLNNGRPVQLSNQTDDTEGIYPEESPSVVQNEDQEKETSPLPIPANDIKDENLSGAAGVKENIPSENLVKKNKDEEDEQQIAVSKEVKKIPPQKNLPEKKFTLSGLPLQIDVQAEEATRIVSEKQEKDYTLDLLSPATEELPVQKDKKSILSLSAIASPIYSYRDIDNKDFSSSGYSPGTENAKISYSGGFHLDIRTSSRLSIETGLVYSRLGIGIRDMYNLASISGKSFVNAPENDRQIYMVSNSIGTIQEEANNDGFVSANSNKPSSVMAADRNDLLLAPVDAAAETGTNINQFFHFLELPLLLKYKVIDRDVDFNLLGGISTNFLVGNSVFLNTGDASVYLGKTENIRTMNYSGNFGFGMEYELTESFLFSLEPLFKYYLHSINEDKLGNTRPYTLGFYTGIRYNF